MINISKSLIQSTKSLRFKNLINTSSKLFAKKKDGATQSDKEVDKSKKTVKSSSNTTNNSESSSSSSSAALGNVKIIESIPGNKVIKLKLFF